VELIVRDFVGVVKKICARVDEQIGVEDDLETYCDISERMSKR
jgi:hypothetical protein